MLGRWLAGMIAVLYLCSCTVQAYDGRQEDTALRSHIEELCEAYEIPVLLVYAVIDRESSWDANAVNADGTCFGLMQINEVNFDWIRRELGLQNPKDPYENVTAGIHMLADYIDRYLDYHMALMCYNCGEAGARRLWEQGIFTSDYSLWIIDRMHELEWQQLSAARERLRAAQA